MIAQHKTCLQNIRNANGGATVATFVDDWEPIGWRVWDDLHALGYVTVVDGKICLTADGVKALDEGREGKP
jgi:hypothetical protein